MGLTNAMRDLIAADVIGEAITEFNNANAHLGVGDSSAGFVNTQTDLQGGSKTRKAMDATFPSRAVNVVTLRATFGTGEANHAWDEWGVFNAAAAGTMQNRKVEALGTKTAVQSWQLTATITWQAA